MRPAAPTRSRKAGKAPPFAHQMIAAAQPIASSTSDGVDKAKKATKIRTASKFALTCHQARKTSGGKAINGARTAHRR